MANMSKLVSTRDFGNQKQDERMRCDDVTCGLEAERASERGRERKERMKIYLASWPLSLSPTVASAVFVRPDTLTPPRFDTFESPSEDTKEALERATTLESLIRYLICLAMFVSLAFCSLVPHAKRHAISFVRSAFASLLQSSFS